MPEHEENVAREVYESSDEEEEEEMNQEDEIEGEGNYEEGVLEGEENEEEAIVDEGHGGHNEEEARMIGEGAEGEVRGQEPRRSGRRTRQPTRLRDFVCSRPEREQRRAARR